MLELTQLRLDEAISSGGGGLRAANEFVRRRVPGAGGLDWLARTGTRIALAAGEPAVARSWSSRSPIRSGGRWGSPGSSSSTATAQTLPPSWSRSRPAASATRWSSSCCGRGRQRQRRLPSPCGSGPSSVACGAGLVQTVASEGAEVLALLEVHAWSAPQEWLDRIRRAAVRLRRVVRGSEPARRAPDRS
jgi:LuxR family maltose regulon positive regulatory protein